MSGHYDPDPHAHPGLHVIAVVEAIKGSLALLAARVLARDLLVRRR